MKNTILATIALLLLSSCHSTHLRMEKLYIIEKHIEDSLNYAFELSQTVDVEQLDDYNKAYYYLLLSNILYKKDKVTVKTDSLLTVSLNIFRKVKDEKSITKALLAKGEVWSDLGESEEALGYFHQALDRAEQGGDDRVLSRIYNEIGYALLDKLLFDDATSFFKKQFECDSLSGNKRGMAIALTNRGKVYLFEGMPELAISCFLSAEKISKQDKDSLALLSGIYNSLSVVCFENSDLEQSLHYTIKSLKYSDKEDEIEKKYLMLGRIHSEMNNLDSAEYYFSKSLLSEDMYTQATTKLELYSLEMKHPNFEKAVGYLWEYQEGLDSLYFAMGKKETEVLSYRYNVDKAVLQARAKHSLIVLSILFISSIIIIGLVIYLYIRNKKATYEELKNKEELMDTHIKILKQEKEIHAYENRLKMLQQQVNKEKDRELEIARLKKLIDDRKAKVSGMLKNIIGSEVEQFYTSAIYQTIQNLSQQRNEVKGKSLNSKEQAHLDTVLTDTFPRFIQFLTDSSLTLNKDEKKLCCLSIAGMNTSTIKLCYSVGMEAIKKKRNRLKNKMEVETNNELLYDFIFGK